MTETELASASDQQLLEGLRAGSDEAYRALFERYSSGIFLRALRFIPTTEDPTDAYDIVQQVFLKFFQTVHRLPFSGEFSVGPYLYRILRNVCIDYARAQRRHKPVIKVPLAEAEDIPDLTHDADAQIDTDRLIKKALEAFSERDRTIVYMRMNDESFPDIANTIGISERAARMRYLRAVTAVRQQFEHARMEDRK
jgi:RNA polymerase sigma-70 factor (ECF subfamily)